MPNDFDTTRVQRTTLLLEDLGRAHARLAEALKQPANEFVRDAAIQRFEFCFELAWKSIQAVARLEGQEGASPRVAFQMAWRSGWISDEAAWLDMLDERNRTSHTYREATANAVFGNLPRHLPHLGQLHQVLTSRLADIRAQLASRQKNQ